MCIFKNIVACILYMIAVPKLSRLMLLRLRFVQGALLQIIA